MIKHELILFSLYESSEETLDKSGAIMYVFLLDTSWLILKSKIKSIDHFIIIDLWKWTISLWFAWLQQQQGLRLTKYLLLLPCLEHLSHVLAKNLAEHLSYDNDFFPHEVVLRLILIFYRWNQPLVVWLRLKMHIKGLIKK